MEEATSDLGVHYKAWKDNEKSKDKDKARFFELINVAVADRKPDEVLFDTWGESEIEARQRAEKYNPRFAVDAIRPKGPWLGVYEAIMVERNEYMSFVFVNVYDGMVYQRQVVDGPQLLDDEAMAKQDPAVYAAATFELPWGERIVRPLDSLEPSILALVQPYIYRGKPTVKLPAPRPATEEELSA